jgi:hypothetical protein
MSADDLIAHAERCKVKVKDGRVDFPRSFPAYASGNRYVSNVPGSTMFVPVTEVTRQYINGLFYVLAQEPGQRPVFLDDFNLFLPCGCERWVKSKFLNKEIPIPLSIYAKGRTEYESLLLLQNLALVSQSMGLGGWIHAAFAPVILLGGSRSRARLNFRFTPRRLPLRPYPPVRLTGWPDGPAVRPLHLRTWTPSTRSSKRNTTRGMASSEALCERCRPTRRRGSCRRRRAPSRVSSTASAPSASTSIARTIVFRPRQRHRPAGV